MRGVLESMERGSHCCLQDSGVALSTPTPLRFTADVLSQSTPSFPSYTPQRRTESPRSLMAAVPTQQNSGALLDMESESEAALHLPASPDMVRRSKRRSRGRSASDPLAVPPWLRQQQALEAPTLRPSRTQQASARGLAEHALVPARRSIDHGRVGLPPRATSEVNLAAAHMSQSTPMLSNTTLSSCGSDVGAGEEWHVGDEGRRRAASARRFSGEGVLSRTFPRAGTPGFQAPSHQQSPYHHNHPNFETSSVVSATGSVASMGSCASGSVASGIAGHGRFDLEFPNSPASSEARSLPVHLTHAHLYGHTIRLKCAYKGELRLMTGRQSVLRHAHDS